MRSLAFVCLVVTCLIETLVLAGGCTYRGRDDAVSQRFTWFSYLNGDDLRARCIPGGPPRYRFVYNGVYIQQVRTYDILPDTAGTGLILKTRVLGPANFSHVVIDQPLTTLSEDPLELLAPFAGVRRRDPFSPRDLDALDQSLAASGLFQPAPEGLNLSAEDFFWLAVTCHDGRIAFNAWRYPSSRFAALTFPRQLFAWDDTGIPVNPPRSLSNFDIYGTARPDDTRPQFSLRVTRDGIVTGKLF